MSQKDEIDSLGQMGMKILFITRTYPPLIGGMEKFASDFYNNYKMVGEIDLLANPGGKKTIMVFLIKVVLVLILESRKYDVIHLYDGVLFPTIPIIRIFSKAKVSFTVNGLDIVYSRFWYQKIMPSFLKKADRIIAISQYTAMQCEARGMPREIITAIPVGITVRQLGICSEREKLELRSKFNIPANGKKILLTVGRLVTRKGHLWFIANVMKNLPDNYIYVIAGSGPQQEAIKNLIDQLNLTERIYMVGRVSDEEKNCLYQISDLFIMPNISVKGDQEGFGIVLLEAAQYGLPVIASNIEGIRDAVINQKTGYLIHEKDAEGFIDAIIEPKIDRSSLPNAVASNFGWTRIIERYYAEFQKIKAA